MVPDASIRRVGADRGVFDPAALRHPLPFAAAAPHETKSRRAVHDFRDAGCAELSRRLLADRPFIRERWPAISCAGLLRADRDWRALGWDIFLAIEEVADAAAARPAV